MKKLIVFDLDGTLAPASRRSRHRLRLLRDLLSIIKVAVISGARGPIRKAASHRSSQAVSSRTCPCSNLWNKILPIRRKWTELYSEDLTADQRKKIIDSLNKAAGESGFTPRRFGEGD